MKTLKNKRGEGYIFPCLMIIVVCMILSVLIFFATSVSLVRITEKNSRIVLDSYVMQNSIQIYHSIKQGIKAFTRDSEFKLYLLIFVFSSVFIFMFL